MTYEIVSVACGGQGISLPSECSIRYIDNSANQYSPCECYQILLEGCDADVIIYIHDDVSIHESNWTTSVMALFDNPQCVAVGIGGATALGHPDLYKKPYSIWNLARFGYVSNQTDWQVHGGHETGSKRVATIEQFFMAIRTDWLRSRRTLGPRMRLPFFLCIDPEDVIPCWVERSGWPTHALTHHMLDGWLACEAAQDGKEIWMTGVSCTHHGGGTSTKAAYAEAKWLKGGSMEADHTEPHRWLYDNYRDVLPIRV